MGRLRRGQTIETAQAELQTVMQSLAREYPAAYRVGNNTTSAAIQTLSASQAAAIRPTLLMLSAAALTLLAIGCMNLAVLLIAKASGRAREILVRVSLGASGRRLGRQLLAEALPLAFIGAAAGLLVASGILTVLVPILPRSVPRPETIGLNGAVVCFSIACSLAIVFLASLVPARIAARNQLSARSSRAAEVSQAVTVFATSSSSVRSPRPSSSFSERSCSHAASPH